MSRPAVVAPANALRTRPVDIPAAPRAVRRTSVWQRFRQHRLALASLLVLLALVAAAILAPLLAPADPDAVSYDLLAGPSAEHPLGTDEVGRDLLSRLIYASRVSLAVGVAVSVLTALVGTVIGSLAGYYGGMSDLVLSGLINLVLSVPALPLAMVLGGFLEASVVFVIVVLSLVTWTGAARLIRAEFLSLRSREYVLAARVLGLQDARIIARHILPNVLGLVIVAATLQVSAAILSESALSYLGFGVQPPTASWGNMLQNAQRYFRTDPGLAVYPGILIALTVSGVNFLGDGLRDAFDPRLRNR
jgi:peptide/nickel transport system permease protein